MAVELIERFQTSASREVKKLLHAAKHRAQNSFRRLDVVEAKQLDATF
jgi:hypothetical protein